jgi:hypothetical protein
MRLNAMQTTFDFEKISQDAIRALKDEFPDSVASVEEGWHGRVHVKIVSSVFDGKSETTKQDIV